MSTRHKHADMIIAWANGAEIEYRLGPHERWSEAPSPRWYAGFEYRIKPPAKKYRVALFRHAGEEPLAVAASSQVIADSFEPLLGFVRWLTDWIEYEE